MASTGQKWAIGCGIGCLLVIVILLLNMVAIHVRNGLREKYRGLET